MKLVSKEEYLNQLRNAKLSVVHLDNNGEDIFRELDGVYHLDLFCNDIGGAAFAVCCSGLTKAGCIEDLIFKIRDYIPTSEDSLYDRYVECVGKMNAEKPIE